MKVISVEQQSITQRQLINKGENKQMSVQYKTSDGWKNISSSSNNAVDTVENGNMSPVTSNAVYDALQRIVQYPSIVTVNGVNAVINGNIKFSGVSGGGILFQTVSLRYLHFDIDKATDININGAILQVGNGHGTIYDMITTGTGRGSYKNILNQAAGHVVVDMNGWTCWQYIFIACGAGWDGNVSNVYFSNQATA